MDDWSLGDVPEFRALMDQVDETVLWIVSGDGEFEYISAGFEELWGIPVEAVEQDPSRLVETIHPEDRERVITEMARSAAEVMDTVYESRVVRPDGEVRWFKVQQYPIRGPDGDLRRVVGICTDITDQKRREEKIRRQRDRLDEFANVISHDLRNPLNVAQGHLSLAMDDCEDDHLLAVERALDRMDELITDVLTLAREGSDVSAVKPVDLAELVTDCWETIDTADATLQVDIDRAIEADESRLRQLFENLIRNAVDHGGTEVTVTIGELPDGFYVEDDGSGIPPENRNEIFKAGYSDSEPGTGFGLPIVKRIAEGHGWAVIATEGTEGGARFEIAGVDWCE